MKISFVSFYYPLLLCLRGNFDNKLSLQYNDVFSQEQHRQQRTSLTLNCFYKRPSFQKGCLCSRSEIIPLDTFNINTTDQNRGERNMTVVNSTNDVLENSDKLYKMFLQNNQKTFLELQLYLLDQQE